MNPAPSVVSKRTVVAVFGLVSLMALAAFLLGVGRAPAPAEVSALPLLVPEDRLDFGDQGCETAFRWTLPVRNTTDAALRIESFRVSCGCARVEPGALDLRPGESRIVTLVIDLTPQREADLALAERPFAVTVSPLLAGRQILHPPWTISGRVINVFQTEPKVVRFTEPWLVGSTPPEREILVQCKEPLASLSAHCDPEKASVLVAPAVDGYRLQIRPSANLRPGVHQFSVELAGVAVSGNPLPTGHVLVVGECTEEVALAPPLLPLGMVPVDSLIERDIELRSRSGRPFEVLSVQVSDRSGTVVERVPADDRVLFRVTQRATGLGSQLQSIVFSVRPVDRPPVELAARISWQGVAAPTRSTPGEAK